MDDLVKQLMHATVSIDGDFDAGCNVRDAAVERLERADAAISVIRRLVEALEMEMAISMHWMPTNIAQSIDATIADAKSVTDRV